MGESPRQENHLSQGPQSDRLDSWKEIAAYLDRDVRTVIRWEKNEGLPVHRHIHHKQATVYAFCSEIEVWQEKRRGSDFEQEKVRGRLFGGNKKIAAGIAVGLAFIVLAPLLWLASPDLPSPNTESLNFQERDWVLIAAFENRTGEAIFDGVLEYALERELSNSRFLNVVSRNRINDTLKLMRKPLDTHIDAEVGREISLRDGGVRVLLAGRVEKLDSRYLLSVQVVDPITGRSIATSSEEAAGQREVLAALRSLSHWGRETLGEQLERMVQSREKLERVTTPSLKALQLYSQASLLADQVYSRRGLSRLRNPRNSEQWSISEQLLKEAVTLDPEFASAHLLLAYSVGRRRNPESTGTIPSRITPPADYMPHAERAFQLAGTATDRERYFIEASYYQMKGEYERAIQAYRTLLNRYPDHHWGINNLGQVLQTLGRLEEAFEYYVRFADLRPNDFIANSIASSVLLVRDPSQARAYYQRARGLILPEHLQGALGAAVEFFPARAHWLEGDVEDALTEIDALAQTLLSRTGREKEVFAWEIASFYLTLGKLGEAEELLLTLRDTRPTSWLLDGLVTAAVLRDDTTRALEGFRALPRRHGPVTPLLLIRLGLLSEGEEVLRDWLQQFGRRNGRVAVSKIIQAELAIRSGMRREGIQLLQEGIDEAGMFPRDDSVVFLGASSLASAWEQQGNFSKAIEVLEEFSNGRRRALLTAMPSRITSTTFWMGLRLQLAQLYRKIGRNEEAREIEDELRRLLAYADADHPILNILHERERTSKAARASGFDLIFGS